jgi:F-type H+-transporting ATPase subunit epsilon
VTLNVEVVSPERILWTGDAEMVIARTLGGGDIAFLTGHAPFVGALDIGKVTVRPAEGSDDLVAVHGGFVEVSHDRVTILSDVAEVASMIDIERARRAKERAETALRTEHDAETEAALRRAHVRLHVAGDGSATTTPH